MSFPKRSLGHHRSLEFGKQNNSFLFLAKRKKRKQTIWIWRSDRWETEAGPPIRTTLMCPTVRVFLCHCHSREEKGSKFCFYFPNYIILFSLFPKNICRFVNKTGDPTRSWFWTFIIWFESSISGGGTFISLDSIIYVHCFWSLVHVSNLV